MSNQDLKNRARPKEYGETDKGDLENPTLIRVDYETGPDGEVLVPTGGLEEQL